MAHSTKSISEDLRRRVVEARLSGSSVAQVAERFAVSTDSVRRWTKRGQEMGTVSALQRGGRKPSKIADREKFEAFAKAHAHCTLAQMQAAWESEVSLMCLSRALKRIGRTHKKSLSPTASVMRQSGNPF
jgi:transposase